MDKKLTTSQGNWGQAYFAPNSACQYLPVAAGAVLFPNAKHHNFKDQQLSVLNLPQSERAYAKMLVDWENEIAYQADYIMARSIRHPVNDVRAAKRAVALAEARAMILKLHPAISRRILGEVRSILADTSPVNQSQDCFGKDNEVESASGGKP